MLRRNSSDLNLAKGKGFDTILKHKVRNLRAKLKNLLSADSCSKYSKRSKQVKKMELLENKQFYSNNTFFNQAKHLFTHTKEQPKQFWYPQKNKCNVMYVFGRLNKQEIQQIKEDMIYYLGEDHVDEFKEFLEVKYNNKQNLQLQDRRLKTSNSNLTDSERNMGDRLSHETQKKEPDFGGLPRFKKDCSITDNFFVFRQSVQSSDSNQKRSSKRLKTANLIESRASMTTKRQEEKQKLKFQANYLGNRQNFLKNRKIIEEQENAQRLLTKVTLEMKQEKATDIFKMTQDAFLSTIKQKNNNNHFKTKKILEDKYKKNVTFGSIVELNEELRKIYIKKITQNPAGGLSEIPEQKSLDKKKHQTTLSNFFAPNSHYRSKY